MSSAESRQSELRSEGVIDVPVDLGESSYAVRVGAGVRRELGECLPAGAKRAAFVTQENISWAEDLAWHGESRIFLIPDGEEAKTMAGVERLCRDFADWGLTRGDVIVGVGGGVVTDVAGFAAAVYHRGVPVVHVPTSLLGQVDAAIGGKTGVNLPEGKNLVGAFWQPSGVLCDTETLATLPEREFRSGCGEIAKCEFLGAAEMWTERQAKPQAENLASQGQQYQTAEQQTALGDMPLTEQIAACVHLKAAIVASDERESGRRALLNYGHTLAHALEIAGGFNLTHGEAVGIGLIYAAEVARLLERIDAERVAEHRETVSSYGLATSLTQGFGGTAGIPDSETLIALFARDKKAVDAVTFILDGPAGPEPVKKIPSAVLTKALELVR